MRFPMRTNITLLLLMFTLLAQLTSSQDASINLPNQKSKPEESKKTESVKESGNEAEKMKPKRILRELEFSYSPKSRADYLFSKVGIRLGVNNTDVPAEMKFYNRCNKTDFRNELDAYRPYLDLWIQKHKHELDPQQRKADLFACVDESQFEHCSLEIFPVAVLATSKVLFIIPNHKAYYEKTDDMKKTEILVKNVYEQWLSTNNLTIKNNIFRIGMSVEQNLLEYIEEKVEVQTKFEEYLEVNHPELVGRNVSSSNSDFFLEEIKKIHEKEIFEDIEKLHILLKSYAQEKNYVPAHVHFWGYPEETREFHLSDYQWRRRSRKTKYDIEISDDHQWLKEDLFDSKYPDLLEPWNPAKKIAENCHLYEEWSKHGPKSPAPAWYTADKNFVFNESEAMKSESNEDEARISGSEKVSDEAKAEKIEPKDADPTKSVLENSKKQEDLTGDELKKSTAKLEPAAFKKDDYKKSIRNYSIYTTLLGIIVVIIVFAFFATFIVVVVLYVYNSYNTDNNNQGFQSVHYQANPPAAEVLPRIENENHMQGANNDDLNDDDVMPLIDD